MRVLDLYCGAGGAGYGYHLAGFEVVGVDRAPQPRYPFAFLRADALSLDPRFLAFFDLVHASPPCQFGTALRHALGAQGCQLQRHRLFEASFPLAPPRACAHTEPVIGVYGGQARKRSAKHGGRGTRDAWEGGHRAAASEAMGITWATLNELSEAIPPAYTRWIGTQFRYRAALARPAA